MLRGSVDAVRQRCPTKGLTPMGLLVDETMRKRYKFTRKYGSWKQEKAAEPYLRELDSILTKLRIIGVSYNEAVKTLNSYHTVATAQRMIHQLERYSAAIIRLQVQAIQLTMAFDNREKK